VFLLLSLLLVRVVVLAVWLLGLFPGTLATHPKATLVRQWFLDDTHTHSSLWLQDADATWRLASRIFQGRLRGVINWRLPVPLTSNQMQSQYVSPVSFESSEVFPCFSIIHIHHLFTIYSPSFFASHFSILQQTEICCPYLSGQDGQAEAGQLRMRSSELVCCQVNALQVRDVANWESNPHFVHQQSIHVLTLWSSCGLADCDFS